MRNLFCLLIICALFIGIQACKPEPVEEELTTGVDLNIRATYGSPDELMLLQKAFAYEDGMNIKFTNFSFYISEIALLQGNGADAEETELKDVELLKLNYFPADSVTASRGQTISIKNVPIGAYTGIRLSLGVPADLNRTKPEEYGSEHPLESVEHYWSGWESYIFAKVEGWGDVNGNNTFDTGLTYHTGMDDSYRERYIYTDIVLDAENTKTINFDIDVKRIFSDAGGFIDIESFPESHSGNEIAQEIMNNFVEAVTLRD